MPIPFNVEAAHSENSWLVKLSSIRRYIRSTRFVQYSSCTQRTKARPRPEAVLASQEKLLQEFDQKSKEERFK